MKLCANIFLEFWKNKVFSLHFEILFHFWKISLNSAFAFNVMRIFPFHYADASKKIGCINNRLGRCTRPANVLKCYFLVLRTIKLLFHRIYGIHCFFTFPSHVTNNNEMPSIPKGKVNDAFFIFRLQKNTLTNGSLFEISLKIYASFHRQMNDNEK